MGYNLLLEKKVAVALHSLNEQNLNSITTGGMKVPNHKYIKSGDYKNAYKTGKNIVLTNTEVQQIVDNLTQEQRDLANLTYKYFNEITKNAKNSIDKKTIWVSRCYCKKLLSSC